MGELHGLRLVVRHVDGGEAELALHGQQLEAQLLAHLRVDVRERLVEEDEVGVGHERPRERHPLLLAAAQLARVLPLQLGDADEPEHVGRRARRSPSSSSAPLQG